MEDWMVQDIELFQRTGRLQTSLVVEAAVLARSSKSCRADEWFNQFYQDFTRVSEVAKIWERRVWLGGHEPHKDDTLTQIIPDMECRKYRPTASPPPRSLQAFVWSSKGRPHRADVSGLRYLLYTLCGRTVFQIDDPGNSISVGIILAETSPRPQGGIQSISATADQAIGLIHCSIAEWEAGLIQFVQDEKVRVVY